MVDTIGDQRTVTYDFTTAGDRFIGDGAIADIDDPTDGSYGLQFTVSGVNDPDFVEGDTIVSYAFFDDGELLESDTNTFSFFRTPGFENTYFDINSLPPSDPGFRNGVGNADQFVRSITYTIPEPASMLAFTSMSGLMLLRRRG